jgi:hypothetical protein
MTSLLTKTTGRKNIGTEKHLRVIKLYVPTLRMEIKEYLKISTQKIYPFENS